MISLDDYSRMGALRFKKENSIVGTSSECPVPPLANLREFVDIAHEYEKSEMTGKSPKDEWIRNAE
ncbi:MAG: hypothetical protein MJY87_04455 [Fibrobacter sp.]|nr:hypothetical protein [Fibrobacter sp.]